MCNKKLFLILILFCTFLGCQKKEQLGKTGRIVAHLKQAQDDVKQRLAHELIWNSAQVNMDLRNYDAVKTGTSSAGIIAYSDSTEVSLGEKTLVIILDRSVSDAEEKSVMALPLGTIDGSIKKSEKKMELMVRTTSGWLKASNASGDARFQATVNEKGDLEVRNHSGELAVATQGREKVLKAKEVLKISAPAGYVHINPEKFTGKEFETEPTKVPQAGSVQTETPKGDVFKITEPANKASVSSETVTVRGILSGKMKAYLNGEEIKASAGGVFSKRVQLNAGINILTFQIVGPGKDQVKYESREIIRR